LLLDHAEALFMKHALTIEPKFGKLEPGITSKRPQQSVAVLIFH